MSSASQHSPPYSTNSDSLMGNRYRCIKQIGSGNFGFALLVEDKNDNEERKVLKQMFLGLVEPGETVGAMQEAQLLSQLHHKNIVQFHHSFMDGHFFCIVMEYCEDGDLADQLNAFKQRSQKVPEEQVISWLKQLLLGISYLHGKRILHRDLKDRNIFLKDNQIKIGDFGISKMLMGSTDLTSTFVGTPYYMSPEVLKHEKYNEKCDIWSLGCVLYEICCFEHAFKGTSLLVVMTLIHSKHTPQLPQSYSIELNNILQSMLDHDVNKRKTAKEILAFPLFQPSDEEIQKMRDEGYIPESAEIAERMYLQEGFESPSDDLSDDLNDTLTSIDENNSQQLSRNALPSFSRTQLHKKKRPFSAPIPSHSNRPLSKMAKQFMEQRITNFRQRCIDALGPHLFNEAYRIASSFSFHDLSPNDDKLKELNNLLPDKSHCMDLERLIYLEKQRGQAT